MAITERHLRAFIAVAEELHFGRAAQRLYIAQPALTQAVQQLEERLGVRLFERTTRRVVLSEVGAQILDDARAALRDLEAIEATAHRHAAGESGTLRVGYMIGAAIDLVPEILRAFAERYPRVALETFEFDFSDPTAGLARGIVDAAVIRPPVSTEPLEMEVLAREPRVVVLPDGHHLADRESVRIAEILDEPIIAAPESSGIWRDYWIAAEHRGGKPATISAVAATREAELHGVAVGRGISITNGGSARFYRRPGVVFVPIEDLDPCLVALAWPAATRNPLVTNLRTVARKVASAVPT